MDQPSPSTYGCNATDTFDDVSVHITDSYEGLVYLCGTNAAWYADFYACGADQLCNNTVDVDDAECPGFNESVCFAVHSPGDFHIYADGDGGGNNPMIYRFGVCPAYRK
jgi:hypothetical protein